VLVQARVNWEGCDGKGMPPLLIISVPFQ